MVIEKSQTARIVFDNNVFQKGRAGLDCALYGPIGDFDPAVSGNAWTNNRFDNGTAIPKQTFLTGSGGGRGQLGHAAARVSPIRSRPLPRPRPDAGRRPDRRISRNPFQELPNC